MSDTMKVQPFDVLLRWILKEYQASQSIFGIHRSLFFTPRANQPYTSQMFGYDLGAPIGPAAGPHTQLAQNIICAWLSGGRFIELKTVQIMDELEIPRPCIDMEDEGYNVEWSQELKLDQSAHEYVNAWALIHILQRVLGFEEQAPLGAIFNMSVGYNLEGIKSAPMTRFMDRMVDASEELARIHTVLNSQFPQFADIHIPTRLTNSVTLSTMHGCPPDEIERIAGYLLQERELHTTVKLNPTLLGQERVLDILRHHLGFDEIQIPDAVFEHDLKYERAVELIATLKQVAAERGLSFGVKLSNTLAMANHRSALPGNEMYMSGRALYPITINLFNQLAREFKGDLNVSYSAGADALNVTTLLSCGARPITAASDLLKPGGYSRFLQYLENLEAEMRQQGAANLDELAQNKLHNLEQAAAEALADPRYKKAYYPYGLPKVESGLDLFDCVVAPCIEPCAVHQDVPEYAWLIAQGEYDRALQVILARNPLPGITGYVCTELCRTRCTRSDYEEPVAIRALKRIAAEKGRVTLPAKPKTSQRASPELHPEQSRRVAIIGAGPSGLSAACFLALNGVQVTIFEAKDVMGGMTRLAPVFRLPTEIIQQDIDRILALGVEVQLSHPITQPPETLLQEGFDAVYIASGFQKDMPLHIEGEQGQGVYAALDLLERVRRGEQVELGAKALVIGGGDTAMDAARVAQRLTGNPATLVYRRTRREMPANQEEREGAFEEGTILEELVTPMRIKLKEGQVEALECLRNRLGEPGADGRKRPVPIEGSEFRLEADSVIVAVGQAPDLYFLHGSDVSLRENGSIAVNRKNGLTGAPHVYAGGDVVEGPESIIAACADGRRATEAICQEFGLEFESLTSKPAALSEQDINTVKRMRARKKAQHRPAMLPPTQRRGNELVESTYTGQAARAEALRCLQCAAFCDKCVEVCPNRANLTYLISTVNWQAPRLACQNGELVITSKEKFQAAQSRQIIHVDDFCNECGNCATFCVHHGQPYTEKPRLFFKQSDFELEDSNAFYIARRNGGWVIKRRESGRESQLAWPDSGDTVAYQDEWVSLVITLADFQVKTMQLNKAFPGELSLAYAAEMYIILGGLVNSMPYLPFE